MFQLQKTAVNCVSCIWSMNSGRKWLVIELERYKTTLQAALKLFVCVFNAGNFFLCQGCPDSKRWIFLLDINFFFSILTVMSKCEES